jgi:uncharacterized membrane protein YqjE
MAEGDGHTRLQDRPTAELVQRLSDNATRLVRAEIELAKAELAAKGKRAGIGAGLLGGAALLSMFALGAVTAAIIALWALLVPLWAAALITAGIYLVVAGIAGLLGKNSMQRAVPPVPEQALETTRTDLELTKARVKEVRS